MYPAYQASGYGSTDIERKWSCLNLKVMCGISISVTVLAEEALGLKRLMRDYFDAHADDLQVISIPIM